MAKMCPGRHARNRRTACLFRTKVSSVRRTADHPQSGLWPRCGPRILGLLQCAPLLLQHRCGEPGFNGALALCCFVRSHRRSGLIASFGNLWSELGRAIHHPYNRRHQASYKKADYDRPHENNLPLLPVGSSHSGQQIVKILILRFAAKHRSFQTATMPTRFETASNLRGNEKATP
jgi:hypothetical protein